MLSSRVGCGADYGVGMHRQARSLAVVLVVVGALVVVISAIALANGLPPGGTFTDDNGNIHEGNIEAIAADGITKGCNPPTNDLYCPGSTVTRGQMAAFLTRALDLPATATDFFTDDDDSIFESDINRMAAAGVTKGCNPPDNDLYCPDGKVTRGQMAAFLVRAFGYIDDGGGDLFIDDDDSIFEGDIDRLGTAGVTKGCNPSEGNTKYCPNSLVLRDQMASFLARALGLSPIVPPPATSSTTTTLPGTDHPQSGIGWEFVGCSNAVGTCLYPQSAAESQLNIDSSLLPPKYCLPDPYEPWKCLIESNQWDFRWYDSGGSPVLPSSCWPHYHGMFIAGVTCKMPIAGAPTGEYRGELCRTEGMSSTCKETLLTAYFNVTS